MAYYNFRENDYFRVSQCYDRMFVPNHCMKSIHKHDGFEIMYVMSGAIKVMLYTDDRSAQEEVYNLFAGDFIFLESERFHRLSVSETGARIINTEVSPCADPLYNGQRPFGRIVNYDERLKEFFGYEPGTFRLYDSNNILGTLFLLTQRYFADSHNTAVFGSVLFVLLNDVAELWLNNYRRYQGHSYVKHAIFLIENSLGNISLDELSESVGISRNYLYKLFRSCFDLSVPEYICEYKVKRACHMLRHFHDIRISDIAAELGFGTLLRFERTFKRVMGITPAEYRFRNRQASNLWISNVMGSYKEFPQ